MFHNSAKKQRFIIEKSGPADFPEQPWKNGGGTTHELRRAPHPQDPQRFAWRISSATVTASGAFSLFPGIDRTLLLLTGNGLALRCGNAPEQELRTPGQSIHFSGDLATYGRLLEGPVQDFNLMVDRTFHRGEAVLIKSGSAALACAPISLVYVLHGDLTLPVPDSDQQLQLTKGELGYMTNVSRFSLQSASTDFIAVKTDIFTKDNH